MYIEPLFANIANNITDSMPNMELSSVQDDNLGFIKGAEDELDIENLKHLLVIHNYAEDTQTEQANNLASNITSLPKQLMSGRSWGGLFIVTSSIGLVLYQIKNSA